MIKLPDIMTQLRQKPAGREKILFVGMLLVISVLVVRSCIWDSHQRISTLQSEIESLKKVPPVPPKAVKKAPEKGEKKWVGTARAVEDTFEILITSAHLHSIKLTNHQFSQPRQEGGYMKEDVSLTVLGSYGALEKYISYLENMPAPLVIDSLSIKRSSVDRDILSMDLSGGLYGAN
ncbi:MAG: hypothetical protein V4534_06140 [Myxococcota bacterium]